MEWIVLGLLILSEMTIYELNSAFSRGLSLIYSASYGNLQYAVKKLLKDDLIRFDERVERGRNKKIYRITDIGRDAFFEWMNSEISTNRLETTVLSKIYFLGLVDSPEDRVGILKEMIARTSEAERELIEMNSGYSVMEIPGEVRKIAEYQLMTLDYGIMSHSAALGWLEKLLEKELRADNQNL